MKKILFSLFAAATLGTMPLGALDYYFAPDSNFDISSGTAWRVWNSVLGDYEAVTSAPNSNTVLVWNDLVTTTRTLSNTAPLSVYGLEFRSGAGGGIPPAAGAYQNLTLATANPLKIGAGGINIAADGCDVYFVNTTRIDMDGSTQTWTIGAGRQLQLAMNGYLDFTGKTLTLAGTGTIYFDTNLTTVFDNGYVKVGNGLTIKTGGDGRWRSTATWEFLGDARIVGNGTVMATLNSSFVIAGNTTIGLSSVISGVQAGYTQLAADLGLMNTITGGGNLTLVNADGSGTAWVTLGRGTAAVAATETEPAKAAVQGIQLASVTIGTGVNVGFANNSGTVLCSNVIFDVKSGATLGFAQLGSAAGYAYVAGNSVIGALKGGGEVLAGRNGGTVTLDAASGTYDFSGSVVIFTIPDTGSWRLGINKTGGSTQTFSGARNDFGTITVNEGKLVIGSKTSVATFAGATAVYGGVLEVNGTMTQQTSGNIIVNAGKMVINGTYDPGLGRVDIPITNGGNLTIAKGGSLSSGYGSGTTINIGASDNTTTGFLTVENGGTLELGAAFNVRKDSIFTVEGTFSGTGGTVHADGTLIVGKNTTYTSSGTTTVNGTLRTSAGGATMQGALVSVGAGGVLDVSDRLSFTKGLTLAGSAAGGTKINFSTEDAIAVSGAALALGNASTNITLNLTGGCWVLGDPEDADYRVNIFDITGATDVTGTWGATRVNLLLDGAALPAGADIVFGNDGDYLYLKGLKYVPIPEPSTWLLLGAGLALGALVRRKRK